MHSLAWKISLPIIFSIWVLFAGAGYLVNRSRQLVIRNIVKDRVESQLALTARAIELFMTERSSPEHVRVFIEDIFSRLDWYELEARSPDGRHTVMVQKTVSGATAPTDLLVVRWPIRGKERCAECHTVQLGGGQGYLQASLNLRGYLQPIRVHYLRTLGLHVLASILLTLIVHMSVVGWIRRPLKQVIGSMERVARVDLNVSFHPRGRDEIGTLVNTTNVWWRHFAVIKRNGSGTSGCVCNGQPNWLPWVRWLHRWRTRSKIHWLASSRP